VPAWQARHTQVEALPRIAIDRVQSLRDHRRAMEHNANDVQVWMTGSQWTTRRRGRPDRSHGSSECPRGDTPLPTQRAALAPAPRPRAFGSGFDAMTGREGARFNLRFTASIAAVGDADSCTRGAHEPGIYDAS
jgi:hypothetical protein